MTTLKDAIEVLQNKVLSSVEKAKAQNELYNSCKTIIRNRLRSFRTLDKFDHQEIESTVIEKVFLKVSECDSSINEIEAWVNWLTNYTALDYKKRYYKKNKQEELRYLNLNEINTNWIEYQFAFDKANPENICIAKELKMRIENFINGHPKEIYRKVLSARFNDSLQCKQIANLLNLQLGHVHTILHRSRIALNDSLSK